MKRITDKQRFDWLQKNNQDLYCHRELRKKWRTTGSKSFYSKAREAIDSAINQGLLGRKGKG